jgi:hypothetical protein
MHSRINRFQHAIDVMRDLVVPNTNNPIALQFEPACARGIPELMVSLAVLRAIDFDKQACRQTSEICHIWSNWDLPPEVRPKGWHLT